MKKDLIKHTIARVSLLTVILTISVVHLAACSSGSRASAPTTQESTHEYDSSSISSESSNVVIESTPNIETDSLSDSSESASPDEADSSEESIYDNFLSEYVAFLSGNRSVSEEERKRSGSIFLSFRDDNGYFSYGGLHNYFEQDSDDPSSLHIIYALTDLNDDTIPELVIRHNFLGKKTTIFKAGDPYPEVVDFSMMQASLVIYENNVIGDFAASVGANFYILDQNGILQPTDKPADGTPEKDLIWHNIEDFHLTESPEKDGPLELYKPLIIENAFSLTEDTTFSLTWNPDGSSEYDTIEATIYKFDYENYDTMGRCDLIVNGKTYEANSTSGIIEAIYVADLNTNDGVKNIITSEAHEGWDYVLHFYAYKGDNLVKLGDAYGELLLPSITGDGTFESYFRRTWRASNNDYIVFKDTHKVNDFDYSLIDQQAGTLENINQGVDSTFIEGYTVKLQKSISYYSDPECTQHAGTLDSGTYVNITGYQLRSLRFESDTAEGWADFLNNGSSASDHILEGYTAFC